MSSSPLLFDRREPVLVHIWLLFLLRSQLRGILAIAEPIHLHPTSLASLAIVGLFGPIVVRPVIVIIVTRALCIRRHLAREAIRLSFEREDRVFAWGFPL